MVLSGLPEAISEGKGWRTNGFESSVLRVATLDLLSVWLRFLGLPGATAATDDHMKSTRVLSPGCQGYRAGLVTVTS